MPKTQEEELTVQILDCIADKPQTLKSLIGLTHSNSATVSWICQNLRGKGIIVLNQEGYFCQPAIPVSSKRNSLIETVTHPSLESPQQVT
ncbi:hypothetical protein [Acaryochloris sp. IP29b_bin.148]|uniref:hypothetical protein n=1 Tax=Acaryochloris sp. IP29b_bin.148 TaxID=2969218 RepID=UPI0026052C72|nr:hypothetical protein [Acaryochloris sp. IP29b_bin.148]